MSTKEKNLSSVLYCMLTVNNLVECLHVLITQNVYLVIYFDLGILLSIISLVNIICKNYAWDFGKLFFQFSRLLKLCCFVVVPIHILAVQLHCYIFHVFHLFTWLLYLLLNGVSDTRKQTFFSLFTLLETSVC